MPSAYDHSLSYMDGLTPEQLVGKKDAIALVRKVALSYEDMHPFRLLLAGDFGTGKSSLIGGMMNTLWSQGHKCAWFRISGLEAAVLNDQKRDYEACFLKARKYPLLVVDDVYMDKRDRSSIRNRYAVERLVEERHIQSTIIVTSHTLSTFTEKWGEWLWNRFDYRVEMGGLVLRSVSITDGEPF